MTRAFDCCHQAGLCANPVEHAVRKSHEVSGGDDIPSVAWRGTEARDEDLFDAVANVFLRNTSGSSHHRHVGHAVIGGQGQHITFAADLSGRDI